MTTPQQPGWYDDPHDPNTQRYWDGQDWTPHRQRKLLSRPTAAPVMPPQPPPQPSPPDQQQRIGLGQTVGDVSPGPGWWQASDLNWYPPQRRPGDVAPLPPPPGADVAGASTDANRPLTEAQRNQILDQAIATTMGGSGYVGTVSSTGQVSLRRTGPIVWKRGTTWAEIWYDTPMTHWAKAVLNVMLCLFTCGLYLPFWFGWSFKAPKTGVLAVDEYGNQTWTLNKISTAQKIMRWVVFAVMVWWLFTAVHYFNEVNSPPRVPPLSPNGFGYGN